MVCTRIKDVKCTGSAYIGNETDIFKFFENIPFVAYNCITHIVTQGFIGVLTLIQL